MERPDGGGSSAAVATALAALEARQAWLGPRRLRLGAVLLAIVAFYAVCCVIAQVNPVKFAHLSLIHI